VYLGAHSHGPNPSSVDLETATHSHYDLLGLILRRYIEFSLSSGFEETDLYINCVVYVNHSQP